MKKIFIGLICGAAALAMLNAPVSALSLAPCPDDENKAACEKRNAELLECWDNGISLNSCPSSSDQKTEIGPTFTTTLDDSEHSVTFKMGHGLILAGNNLSSAVDNKAGLMLVAGNNLSLRTKAEYGFLLGNTINFAGETGRDLYIFGNSVVLTEDSKPGRDVFAFVNTLTVDTDIPGDLAVAVDTLVLNDVKIAGNLEINAAHVEFHGKVEIAGALIYNDSAVVTGLDQTTYGSVEAYHIEKPDPAALMVARVYGKIMSIAGIFLVMALICSLYPRLHDKLEAESTVGRFGSNLALGLGILIAVPIVALFAFFTLIAAPLGIIAILIYLIAIYLAQGFAGAWLGHVLIEKLFKAKGNIFVEILVGVTVLGLLSLVPYLGIATTFLSLLLGLGVIFSCIKPTKKHPEADPSQSSRVIAAEAETEE